MFKVRMSSISDSYPFLDTSGATVKFVCPHYYEMSIKQVGSATGNTARMRRLAQEAVTLSTSLPLSASSSVFVRCDEDRMDVMKVRKRQLSHFSVVVYAPYA